MIAYDLDGVLLPDFDRIPSIGDQDEFFQLTMSIRPLFVPKGEYLIITSRDAEYKHCTVQWANKYLSNPPLQIYQEKYPNETPSAYKARMLNTNPKVQLYIESDLLVVDKLIERVYTACTILHFDSTVNMSLQSLIPVNFDK